MRTTLLNPTVWLLAATALTAAAGVLRNEDASHSFERAVRYASAWPVLVALLLMAVGGLVSRTVLAAAASPEGSAWQVAAVRRFLEQRPSDAAETRAAFAEWMAEGPVSAPPWTPVPGVTECPARAMSSRVPLFTNQAHTPMLLLVEAPLVRIGGGRALHAALLLLSLAAVVTIVAVLLDAARLNWRSPPGLLLISAVAGWQPVLAGVRQVDVVLPAAGLVIVAWHLARRHSAAGSGLAGSLAACLALPAVGVMPALLRSAPRAAAIAVAFLTAAVAGTVAVAGFQTLPGFLLTSAYAARMYSPEPTNYSVIGRAITANFGTTTLITALTAAVILSWWRGRTTDVAFGSFLTLGLLVAPILWSQHLVLLLVPAAVLLRRIWTDGSSWSLAAWAVLFILFSLPDPAVNRLSAVFPAQTDAGGVIPLASVALVIVWSWIAFATHAPQRQVA